MVHSYLNIKVKLLGVWFPYLHCVFISYFPLNSIPPVTLTTLLLLEHEGACSCHRDVALAVHLPEMAISQIPSQLLPCLSNVTFSRNPSLTTLCKSTTASSVLALLVSLPCLISLHTQDFPFLYFL